MAVMQSLSEKMNAAAAAKEVTKAWFVEHQAIKKALAPSLWSSLLRMLESEREAINKNTATRITVTAVTDNELRFKNTGTGRVLVVKFDSSTPCVWYQTHGP